MKRLILLLVAAVVLVAVPTAQAARTVKFTLTYEGTLTTTWNLPRYVVPANCYTRAWEHGDGKETWRIRTRGPQKVQVTQASPTLVFFLAGWGLAGNGSIQAGGLISRDAHMASGFDPGPCGGPTGIDPPRPTDCGDRLPSYSLNIGYLNRSLSVQPFPTNAITNQHIAYATCILPTADDVVQGQWPSGVNGRLTRSQIFGRARTLTVRGSRTWSEPHHSSKPLGQLSTTTKLDWTVVLRRAG